MSTLDFYNDTAETYIEATKNVDMSGCYGLFLKEVPAGGKILDLGCGSGRDTLFFKQCGYEVVAVDGSKRICDIASEVVGQRVLNITFEDICFKDQFDGIWACASLLHVCRNQMRRMIEKLEAALHSGGILYASYKYGDSERVQNGKQYTDYNEKQIEELFFGMNMAIDKLWISEDNMRRDEKWINIIARKNR